MRVAILISGRGTNAEALLQLLAKDDCPGEAVLLLSNRPDAAGLALGDTYAVPAICVDHTHYDTREAFEDAMQAQLTAHDAELVCLAGFMRLLNADFVNRWKDRMINIHPSLLPSYKGLDTYARALEDGAKIAGCTVHYVRAEMDDGPILGQAAVSVLPTDTPETLAQRVKEAEHHLYPKCLDLIVNGRVRVRDKIVVIDDTDPAPQVLMSP